ncbi:MAG: hypothetical protein U0U69_05450 [Acidimicrobiia bacterium]
MTALPATDTEGAATPGDGAETEGPAAPPLAPLLDRWARHPGTVRLEELAGDADAHTVVAVADALRAPWLAALPKILGRPVVAVVASSAEVERTAADVACFAAAPEVLPAWETLPYEHVSPTVETMGRRMQTLHAWASDSPPALTLVPVRALLQRVAPTAADAPWLRLAPGEVCDLEDLERRLVEMGYERTTRVETRGEFAVRGGIIDVFASTDLQPVRVELWGDEIDTIRRFHVADQRSVDAIGAVELLPCRELRPETTLCEVARRQAAAVPGGQESLERFADGELFNGMESWLPWLLDDSRGTDTIASLLPADALVVVCDPRRCLDRAADLRREEEDLAVALERTWFMPHAGALEALTETEDAADGDAPAGAAGDAASATTAEGVPDAAVPAAHIEAPRLFADASEVLAAAPCPVWQVPSAPPDPSVLHFGAGVVEGVLGHPDALAGRLRTELARGQGVVVAVEGRGAAARIRELLVDEGVALELVDGALAAEASGGLIVTAPLSRGFVSVELGLTVLAGRHHGPAPAHTAGAGQGNPRHPHEIPSTTATLRERLRRAPPRCRALRGHHPALLGGVGASTSSSPRARTSSTCPLNSSTPCASTWANSPRLAHGRQRLEAPGQGASCDLEIADLCGSTANISRAPGHAFDPDGDPPDGPGAVAAFPYEETPDQEHDRGGARRPPSLPLPMDRASSAR